MTKTHGTRGDYMKSIKRIVDTGFWSDEKVMNFSPEDKYFWLFLLTNEYTTQLGIYYLPIKKAALDLGYSVESVEVLLERFEHKYELIKYSKLTDEVAINNYLLYSIVKGGKPVYDCLIKEQSQVKDKRLLEHVYNHLSNKDINNNTVLDYINNLSIYINDNDNDNERIVGTNRGYESSKSPKEKPQRKIIPPQPEWVKEYCESRKNNVDYQKFMDFYESKGWLVGKTKMKDWEAAVRTWESSRKDQKPATKPNGFKSGELLQSTSYNWDEINAELGIK